MIDDGGEEAFARCMEFYRRLGFRSLQGRPERMFITSGTIRAMFVPINPPDQVRSSLLRAPSS